MKRTNKACERVFIRECKTTRLMLKLEFDGVIDMKIREVNENKKQFISLLLLADEQESMVDRYLEKGTMYVLEDNDVIIATDNDEIVGFGDIDSSGYLDRLFVHKNHQHKGIATAICDESESSVTGKKIITHSSITAKPFFEKRGYRVKKEQTIVRNGISLTNFIMEK